MKPISIFFLFMYIVSNCPSLSAMIKDDEKNLCAPLEKHVAKDCTLQSWMNFIDGKTLIKSGKNEQVQDEFAYLPPEISEKIYGYIHDYLKKVLSKAAKRIHPSDYDNFLKGIPERFRQELEKEVLFYPQRWYSYSYEIKNICRRNVILSKDKSTLYGSIGDYSLVSFDPTTLETKKTIIDSYPYSNRIKKPEKVAKNDPNKKKHLLYEINSEIYETGLWGVQQIIHDAQRNKLYIFKRHPHGRNNPALIYFDLEKNEISNVDRQFSSKTEFAISADNNYLYAIGNNKKRIINLETNEIRDLQGNITDSRNGDQTLVATSDDGSLLAVEKNDDSIHLFSLKDNNRNLIEKIKTAHGYNDSLAFTPTGHLVYWAYTNILAIHKPKSTNKKRRTIQCTLPINRYSDGHGSIDINSLKDPIRLPDYCPATKQRIFFINKKDIPLIEHFHCGAIIPSPDNNKIRLFSYNELTELTPDFTIDQAHYLKYLETILKDAQLKKEDSFWKKLHYLLALKSCQPCFSTKHNAIIDRYLYQNTIGLFWYRAKIFFVNCIYPFLFKRNHMH